MAPCRLRYPHLALILAGLHLITEAQRQVTTLTCVCTTSDCEALGVSTCNTTHLCYTQSLERADGSVRVDRGCITNSSPLLCENRPPAFKGKWPLLFCCNTSLCNQVALPTQPAWQTDKGNITNAVHPNTVISNSPISTNARKHATDGPTVISPIYIIILVVGISLLLIIAGVAAIVIRRHALFYRREFGIDRRNYMKGQDLAAVSRLHESESSRTGFYNDSKAILST